MFCPIGFTSVLRVSAQRSGLPPIQPATYVKPLFVPVPWRAVLLGKNMALLLSLIKARYIIMLNYTPTGVPPNPFFNFQCVLCIIAYQIGLQSLEIVCVYLLFKCTDIDVYVCMYRLVRGLDEDQNKTESLHCIQTRLQKRWQRKVMRKKERWRDACGKHGFSSNEIFKQISISN